MTPKQEKFCNIYHETGNASEAYRSAYSCKFSKETTVNRKACALLKKGNIRARVDQMQQELRKASEITKEMVLEELSAIAFADIRDYLWFDGFTVRFKPFSELTPRQAKAIESVKQTKAGIELKLHGKSWSIERVCKLLGFEAPRDIKLLFDKMDEGDIDQIINQIITTND